MKKKIAREEKEKGRCFFIFVFVYSEERGKEKETSIFSFVWFVEKTELRVYPISLFDL